MTDSTSNAIKSWMPTVAIIASILVSYGSLTSELKYLRTELDFLRDDVRSRTKDRIYSSEHNEDVRRLEIMIRDLDNRMDRRITRNESHIFGGDDGGAK